MLTEYKRRANIGAGVLLVSLLVIATYFTSAESPENVWESGNILVQGAAFAMTFSWFYILWAYAKGKGRSGWWVLAGLLSWIGLLVLLLLADKHKQGDAAVTGAASP
jgi:hypothetical protein